MEKKKIWVVGHKHPDTDSICAAIAYANLKNCLEKKNTDHKVTKEYAAKRAGSLNAEKFIAKCKELYGNLYDYSKVNYPPRFSEGGFVYNDVNCSRNGNNE